MVRDGVVDRGEFNVREIDDVGNSVRVFSVPRTL